MRGVNKYLKTLETNLFGEFNAKKLGRHLLEAQGDSLSGLKVEARIFSSFIIYNNISPSMLYS